MQLPPRYRVLDRLPVPSFSTRYLLAAFALWTVGVLFTMQALTWSVIFGGIDTGLMSVVTVCMIHMAHILDSMEWEDDHSQNDESDRDFHEIV